MLDLFGAGFMIYIMLQQTTSIPVMGLWSTPTQHTIWECFSSNRIDDWSFSWPRHNENKTICPDILQQPHNLLECKQKLWSEIALNQNGYLLVVCQQIASELNTFLLVLLLETLPTTEENHWYQSPYHLLHYEDDQQDHQWWVWWHSTGLLMTFLSTLSRTT